MKNFRIAKCIERKEVGEYAIFEDGSKKKRIELDANGNKYFRVDNELNLTSKELTASLFTGRIIDAVNTIRAGGGDCIQTSSFMSISTENVIYFLDRKVGESYREQFLKGFVDTEFAWKITVGDKNSLSGYRELNRKNELISVFYPTPDDKRLTFETERQAEEHIKALISKAVEYTTEIAKRCGKDTDDKNWLCVKAELDEKIPKNNIIWEFIYDMLRGDFEANISDTYCLNDMGYTIAQCIV